MSSAQLTKLARRVPTQALGALAGQITLALSSFVLHVVASRELGAAGFGAFALLFGAIVMATALSTGLVGDSLTVLDRSDPRLRAALVRIGVLVVTALALIGFLISLTRISVDSAALFALALAAFLSADLVRRLLMATLRFWNLVLADTVGFVAMAVFLLSCHQAGALVLNHFLGALAVGQLVAGLVALTRLPPAERKLNLQGWGDWQAVIRYGSWRALQQFVRPTMLNTARWVVLILAGAAAVGELEAARVFVAPAMLLVQGFGSYLFSSYAADRGRGAGALLARADRAAMIMLIGAVVVAVVAGVLLPHLGWLLTAGRYELSVIAVLGWACYAASCAAVLPYGSLAAVQGKQQWVLLIRVLDSLLGLALVVAFLMGLGSSAHWMPWLLSVGSFVGGLVCRQVLIRPGARAETAAATVSA